MKNKIIKTVLTITIVLTGLSAMAEESESVPAKDVKPSAQAGSLTLIPVMGGTSMDLTGLKANNALGTNTTTSTSGGVLGVLGGYKIDFWDATLESGLLYMETGTEVGNFFFGYETTVSYLSIPLNIQVPIWEISDTPIYAKGGMMAAFLMDAEINGTGFATGANLNIKDEVNSFDAIAQIGIGGTYKIDDKFTVQADLNYLRGLTEVLKDGGGYNQGLSALVALAISI